MEIKINRDGLFTALSLAQGVVDRKTTKQILTNILFEATAKTLELTATDLEVGMTTLIPSETIAAGRVAVNAQGIHEVVREIPENTTLHLSTTENNWLMIRSGSAEFKIMGISADEFPALPTKGEGSQTTIEATTLEAMIEKTAIAMSTDETRYTLNGIFIEQAEDNNKTVLRMVATDGHRLSVTEREIAKGWAMKKGVILPRKGVVELKKLAERAEGSINLWIDEKYAIAYSGPTTLVVRLIDGQFPPYSQVIPKESKRVIAVGREDIKHALRRMAVVTSGQTRGVRLVVSPKNIEISSSNPEFGEAHEALVVQYRGESFEVGFNARYFLDVLSVLEDDQAVLKMGDDTAPCLITSEIDPGFMHIIMPMRL